MQTIYFWTEGEQAATLSPSDYAPELRPIFYYTSENDPDGKCSNSLKFKTR